MIRRVLGCFLIAALAWGLAVRADDPAPKDKPKDKVTADLADQSFEQKQLKRQYELFEASLLQLAQRLQRSPKAEDRERANILKEALKKASDEAIKPKFETLINLLTTNKAISLTEIRDAMDRSKMLADDIHAVLEILLSDNRDAQIKAEKERLKKLLEMLDKIIRDQKIVRAQGESGQEKKALSKAQEKVTNDTRNLAKAMGKDAKSDGKGDGKGDSKDGKDGKGDKSDGGGKSGGNGKDGQPKDGKSSPNNNNQQPGDDAPGRKQVQDAIENMKRAQENIEKQKKDETSEEQSKAIKNLEEARKRLEERLRQLRDEELERLLANLEARCQKMLAMQIEVYEGTTRVDKAILQNADRKPTRAEEQRSLQLSDKEQAIVREANSAIKLLEDEGSAVAFPEVFQQVRDDMINVARRLGKVDVGSVTQTIEQDIIATLKEMIEALKKAQQAGKGGQGQSGKPPNQALLDLLAELKMIRSLQVRVNSRTLTYARQYTGEQANDPDIQKELGNLAQHQEKIFKITNDLARGKNK
jgi:hypothetical protein